MIELKTHCDVESVLNSDAFLREGFCGSIGEIIEIFVCVCVRERRIAFLYHCKHKISNLPDVGDP